MAQTTEILEALPPAQEQPAGLALLDLNVTATPLVITWDKYAVSALQWACGEGVITGVTESTLVPQGTATRAQAAAMLQRFCENVK